MKLLMYFTLLLIAVAVLGSLKWAAVFVLLVWLSFKIRP